MFWCAYMCFDRLTDICYGYKACYDRAQIEKSLVAIFRIHLQAIDQWNYVSSKTICFLENRTIGFL